jgi:hypothetical protein
VQCEPRQIDTIKLAQMSGPTVHGSNDVQNFLSPRRFAFAALRNMPECTRCFRKVSG